MCGGVERSKAANSFHRLSYVRREQSELEGQKEILMRRPSYHELFPRGYKVNPSDLANSVPLTRLPQDKRLNATVKTPVGCLATIV